MAEIIDQDINEHARFGEYINTLLDELRGAGIPIGPRERSGANAILVQWLMSSSSSPKAPLPNANFPDKSEFAAIREILAPILARSRSEREIYHKVFDRLFSTAPQTESVPPKSESRLSLRRLVFTALIFVLPILAIALGIWSTRSQSPPPSTEQVSSEATVSERLNTGIEFPSEALPVEESIPLVSSSDRLVGRIIDSALRHDGAPTLEELGEDLINTEDEFYQEIEKFERDVNAMRAAADENTLRAVQYLGSLTVPSFPASSQSLLLRRQQVRSIISEQQTLVVSGVMRFTTSTQFGEGLPTSDVTSGGPNDAFNGDQLRAVSTIYEAASDLIRLERDALAGLETKRSLGWSADTYTLRISDLTGLSKDTPISVLGISPEDTSTLTKLAKSLGRIETPGSEPSFKELSDSASKALSGVDRPRVYRISDHLPKIFPDPLDLPSSPGEIAAEIAKYDREDEVGDDRIGPGPGTDIARALALRRFPHSAFDPVPWHTPEARAASVVVPDWFPAIVASPAWILALWILFMSILASPYLTRRTPRIPPLHTNLVSNAKDAANFEIGSYDQAARQMLRRRTRTTFDLDILETVRETLKQGGRLIVPVHSKKREKPEYLALIERSSPGDHEANRARQMIELLSELIHFDIYYYHTSVAELTDEDDRNSYSIEQLQTRHPDHRLIIFGRGETLLDPISLEPTPTSSVLLSWSERALLTPLPLAEWSRSEFALTEGLAMPIGRSTAKGLESLAGMLGLDGSQFGTRLWTEGDGLARPLPDILRTRPQRFLFNLPPGQSTEQEIIRELRNTLDPETFDWFAALAVYPAIQWDLTMFLGVEMREHRGAENRCIFTEDRLAQLSQLPWLKAGRMPNWLRRSLISSLSKSRKAEISGIIKNLLRAAQIEDPNVLNALRLRIGREPRKEKSSIEQVLSDDVLLDFLSDARREDFSIPKVKEIQDFLSRGIRERLFGSEGFAAMSAIAFAVTALIVAPNSQSGPVLTGGLTPLVLLFAGALLAILAWRWGRSIERILSLAERMAPAAFAFSVLLATQAIMAPSATGIRNSMISRMDAATLLDARLAQEPVDQREFLAAEHKCLSETLYHEARSEGVLAQRGVAKVVLDRVRNQNYPNSVCDVAYQGVGGKLGCQFSFACNNSVAISSPEGSSWEEAQRLAAIELFGSPASLLNSEITHYHANFVQPVWASELTRVASFGTLEFYSDAAVETSVVTSDDFGVITPRTDFEEGIASVLPDLQLPLLTWSWYTASVIIFIVILIGARFFGAYFQIRIFAQPAFSVSGGIAILFKAIVAVAISTLLFGWSAQAFIPSTFVGPPLMIAAQGFVASAVFALIGHLSDQAVTSHNSPKNEQSNFTHALPTIFRSGLVALPIVGALSLNQLVQSSHIRTDLGASPQKSAFSETGEFAMIAQDGTLIAFDERGNVNRQTSLDLRVSELAIAGPSNKQTIAFVDEARRVFLWPRDSDPVQILTPDEENEAPESGVPPKIALAPNGAVFAVFEGESGQTVLHSSKNGAFSIDTPKNPAIAIAALDQDAAVVANLDGTMTLVAWNGASPSTTILDLPIKSPVRDLTFDESNRLLKSVHVDGNVLLINVDASNQMNDVKNSFINALNLGDAIEFDLRIGNGDTKYDPECTQEFVFYWDWDSPSLNSQSSAVIDQAIANARESRCDILSVEIRSFANGAEESAFDQDNLVRLINARNATTADAFQRRGVPGSGLVLIVPEGIKFDPDAIREPLNRRTEVAMLGKKMPAELVSDPSPELPREELTLFPACPECDPLTTDLPPNFEETLDALESDVDARRDSARSQLFAELNSLSNASVNQAFVISTNQGSTYRRQIGMAFVVGALDQPVLLSDEEQAVSRLNDLLAQSEDATLSSRLREAIDNVAPVLDCDVLREQIEAERSGLNGSGAAGSGPATRELELRFAEQCASTADEVGEAIDRSDGSISRSIVAASGDDLPRNEALDTDTQSTEISFAESDRRTLAITLKKQSDGTVETVIAGQSERNSNRSDPSVAYKELPGWQFADLAPGFAALRRSCEIFRTQDADGPLSRQAPWAGNVVEWLDACDELEGIQDERSTRFTLENLFTPVEIVSGDSTSRFTGYFEPVYQARFSPEPPFTEPVPALPDDAITSSGVLYQVSPDGSRRKYPPREEITRNGVRPLAYAHPADVFFLQIQGSGRLIMADGRTLRVVYAGNNGQPFRSIANWLVTEGLIERRQASMQGIKNWMNTVSPERARQAINVNPRFVFFELEAEGDPRLGPQGWSGAPLTPLGSMAIDASVHAFGVPMFVQTSAEGLGGDWSGLLVAQDTGGALMGSARGDIYFGTGGQAGMRADTLNSPGRLWVLLPRKVAERIRVNSER